jgi:hypothetical protein
VHAGALETSLVAGFARRHRLHAQPCIGAAVGGEHAFRICDQYVGLKVRKRRDHLRDLLASAFALVLGVQMAL